jgi:AcrR family transcriptional regulator
MSRPSVITEGQILDAARSVFLERGITATTAEVAKRAGIAEGSIFKRYKTKVDLFRAAIAPALDDPEWLKLLDKMAGSDLRQSLVTAGLEAIAFFRQVLPLHMMSWSNAAACVAAGASPVNTPALRILKRVTAFFEAEMRAARLRRHDPEILARVYLGSLNNYVFFETVFKAHDELPLAPETFLRGLVNILFTGVER